MKFVLSFLLTSLISAQSFANESLEKACEDLRRQHPAELNTLYANALAGAIPDGPSFGCVVGRPGIVFNTPVAEFLNEFWKGKIFDRKNSRLMNDVMGSPEFAADVYYGKSWYDGKDSIIIEYATASPIIGFVRDEIREVEPGVYYGRAYKRTLLGPVFALHFVLFFK